MLFIKFHLSAIATTCRSRSRVLRSPALFSGLLLLLIPTLAGVLRIIFFAVAIRPASN